MGRSWGQRSLIKCNWILQEGSRVRRPCSCVERAWERRFLEGTANPISYFVFVRKKEKGIHHSEFLFLFPSEKGKGNKDCVICDLQLRLCFYQNKKKGIHHSKFLLCFLQIKEKEMQFLFVSFRRRKIEFSLNFLFSLEKSKRNWGLCTVGPSISCTCTQHKKTTHSPVYHTLYTQQNAEKCGLFFLSTLAVKNWKLISFLYSMLLEWWLIQIIMVPH